MTSKIAVSLPSETLRKLERARRKEGLTRSAAVQRAIDRWLSAAERDERVREYVESYRNKPERTTELAAWERAEAWEEWE